MTPPRRTTDSKRVHPIAPNVLERDFQPEAPNEAWAGDVTYIHTAEGWAYLAVLLDLYSRRVVDWALSDTNDTGLALAALDRALNSRAVRDGLVHHTDRGTPYASTEYRRALDEHGIVASTSRTGDCWDEPGCYDAVARNAEGRPTHRMRINAVAEVLTFVWLDPSSDPADPGFGCTPTFAGDELASHQSSFVATSRWPGCTTAPCVSWTRESPLRNAASRIVVATFSVTTFDVVSGSAEQKVIEPSHGSKMPYGELDTVVP